MKLTKVNGTHTCFYCSSYFSWESRIKNNHSNSLVISLEEIKGVNADVAFIDEDTVEVLANCPACRNKNKFQHSTKQ